VIGLDELALPEDVGDARFAVVCIRLLVDVDLDELPVCRSRTMCDL
jgi:hypothetical protein